MSITISTKLIIGVLVFIFITYVSKEIFSICKYNLKQDKSILNITNKLDRHLSKNDKKKIEKEADQIQKDLENTLELNIFDIKAKDIEGASNE